MGGSPSYSFTCLLPPDGARFVRSPPVRGTLDIVWSCLAVLLLSTWEIKPEVPWSVSTKNGLRKAVAQLFTGIAKTSLVLIVIILAPEVITAYTVHHRVKAHYIYHEGKEQAEEDGVAWNRAKVYFAMNCGFKVNFSSSISSAAPTRRTSQSPARPRYINGSQLLYLRKQGVLKSLPELSAKELADRDKSNVFVQVLAFIQTLWLMVQVIVRLSTHLFVTQLEIVTFAFASLALVDRAIDWHRPRGIYTTDKIDAERSLSNEEEKQLRRLEKSREYYAADVTGLIVGMLFGGLHCLAWNEGFPTPIERTLWRVSAITTTVIPLTIPFWAIKKKAGAVHDCLALVGVLLGCTYGLARCFIMGETIRALFYQPPDAFKATWTGNFPHIG